MVVRSGRDLLGLWLTISLLLNRWSRWEDRESSRRSRLWLNGTSSIGAVMYGVTIHFAAINWILSLQPAYHSTIAGPLLASQQLQSGFAAALLVFALTCERPPLERWLSSKALTDLGTLMLVFVILWSYMWWFEFMLIWIANLPDDVVWYVDRLSGGWFWVTIGLVTSGFAIPFLLLLQRAVKQRPRILAGVAVLLLLVQLTFVHWQTLPSFQPSAFGSWWISLVAPPALGGLWLSCFLWRLMQTSALPLGDPNVWSAERLRLTDEWEAEWEESIVHA